MTETAADAPNLRQQIANAIATLIRDGRYATGARLPSERDLAEEYRVSRPTIREAMIILEARGLVEPRQGAGIFVVDAPRAEMAAPELEVSAFDLIEARRSLEGDTCALAAMSITDAALEELTAILNDMSGERDFGALADLADRRFHVAIAKATGNSVMVAMVENLWDLRYKPSCRDLLDRASKVRKDPLVDDHQEILAALRAHDSQGARKAMRDHLGRVIDHLAQVIEEDTLERARAQIESRRSELARRALD